MNQNSINISRSELIDKINNSIIDTAKTISDENLLSKSGMRNKKDGIVILIDEVDHASDKLDFGVFLKNLTDIFMVEECYNILFILSGLPKAKDILLRSHRSSSRIVEEMELGPLDNEYVENIFLNGLKSVNDKISPKIVKLDNDALELMINISEGYPHFVQQIGSSVFNINDDYIITMDDATFGIYNKNGAIDLIGNRYYHDLYYNKIKEKSYRDILNIMARKSEEWVSRKEILKEFKKKINVLDNGLRALRNRNIIIANKGRRGIYKLQWKGFSHWIKTQCKKEEKTKK